MENTCAKDSLVDKKRMTLAARL